jgi:hypothetical protein
MQPIDGYYLYGLGCQLHPLVELRLDGVLYSQAYMPMLQAQAAVSTFLTQSIYQIRTCRQAGTELLEELEKSINQAHITPSIELPAFIGWSLVEKAKQFEAVLRAELGTTPMYYVTPKHNLDVAGMINAGHLCFPPDLASKAPEALPDAQQAAKCIAFDLPTAAGFHLHRANESVLRRYFDQVAGADKRPQTRNMGDYLNKMRELKVGNKKVLAALRDMKDLHRNPLMHPEEHISNVSDAIALMGGVNSAMALMLKDLPTVPPMTADMLTAMFEGQAA